jgi:hypothetical protein
MSPGYHWDWRSPSSVTHLRKVYFDEKKPHMVERKAEKP